MNRISESIRLVPAETGRYDEWISDLVFETDPKVFGCLVRGDRALFSRWITPLWQAAECSYSHDCATVALENGELLGFEQGYGGDRHDFLKSRSGEKTAGVFSPELIDHMKACSRHLNYIIHFIPKSAYYIHLLSVRKDRQGLGVGRRLLENVFARAADAGYKSVQLDVYGGNPAVGFYEAMGLEKRLETRFPAMQKICEIPPHFRMVRDL
ncbi:GNAT family N-acetyltransferase [bacterium]|nr:GNAT family N-acetyltransferase [bacterium]